MFKQCKMRLWREVADSGEFRGESGGPYHVYG